MEKFFKLLEESLKDTSGKWSVRDFGWVRFINLTDGHLPPTCPIEQTFLILKGMTLDNLQDMGKNIGLTLRETIQIIRTADNKKSRPEFDSGLRRRLLDTLNLRELENAV